jgi:hypothetical protein
VTITILLTFIDNKKARLLPPWYIITRWWAGCILPLDG